MGMTTPQVVVHRDKELMAQAAAARLITKIVDAQAARGSASVVLTGGRNGNGLLAALAAAPARDAIDWSRIDLWWGDERYVPADDPERNHVQAREALLDAVPADPARVHAMPASDGPYGADVDAAAAAYAAELARAATPEDHGPVPQFDVLMLGVGPDTHVASLFPEHPAARETERTVVGVHGAPKPPPTRVSLTLPAIRAAREVWLLAAGEDKAGAVAIALGGAGGCRPRRPRPTAAAARSGCWTARPRPSSRPGCTPRLPPERDKTSAPCRSPTGTGRFAVPTAGRAAPGRRPPAPASTDPGPARPRPPSAPAPPAWRGPCRARRPTGRRSRCSTPRPGRTPCARRGR